MVGRGKVLRQRLNLLSPYAEIHDLLQRERVSERSGMQEEGLVGRVVRRGSELEEGGEKKADTPLKHQAEPRRLSIAAALPWWCQASLSGALPVPLMTSS